METKNFSPIILFAYDRPWHTEQVLRALKQNELASQSELIIYVDGPKANATQDQLEKIDEVKRIVGCEKWCKKVDIHMAEKNIGCRNSIIKGISDVLQLHEAVIVLEDDIVTAPCFLRYMNTALDYYKNRKSVFSISGYNFPEIKLPIPLDYEYDVYVSPRLLNWGWGIWRDRWQQVDWDKKFIPEFLTKKNQVEAFNRGGIDLSKMLLEEFEGKTDAWDIQLVYSHFLNHALSIVPCHSYTENIGLDGTGVHCTTSDSFKNDLKLSVYHPRLLDVLYEDKRILNLLYSLYYPKKRVFWKKILNQLSRRFGAKKLFILKKKVYV